MLFWSAAGQSLVNQISQWHRGTSKNMRAVTTDGHRGGHGIDTRGSRDWAEAHLSNQKDASDSDDSERIFCEKTAGHALHFCGLLAPAVNKS